MTPKYILTLLEKRIIIDDEMKKARDPSRVLLFIFIVPKILPNKAAKLSDIVIINNEINAILMGKKKIIIDEDKNTYDAPVIFFDSLLLVKLIKK